MSCAYCNYPLQDTAVCGSVRHFELNSSLVPGTSFLGRTGLLYVLRAACGELASGTRVALNTTYDSSSLFVFHTCLHCSTVQVSVRLCHLQADSVNLDRGVHCHSQTKIVMYGTIKFVCTLPRYSSTMYQVYRYSWTTSKYSIRTNYKRYAHRYLVPGTIHGHTVVPILWSSRCSGGTIRKYGRAHVGHTR